MTSDKSLQVPEPVFTHLENGRITPSLLGCCEDLMSLSVFNFGYRPGLHLPFLGVCGLSWPLGARLCTPFSLRQPRGGLVFPPDRARVSASVGLTGSPSRPCWSPAMDADVQELLVGACWAESLLPSRCCRVVWHSVSHPHCLPWAT